MWITKIRKKLRISSGFTFIELLIVMGILSIIAAFTIPVYGDLQSASQLSESAAQVIQTLRQAREQSLAGLNNGRHGVYFEINSGAKDKFIIYQGAAYASRDMDYDREVILENSVAITTTLAGNEVNFSQGLGLPSQTGAVFINRDGGESKEITINSYGIIESR